MNKQLDFNPKFPQHNPFKFLYYNEAKNGFYLDNPNQLYVLDEAKGWADYNGCYYQRDGAPAGWVFVRQGKFTRYDMNQRKVETNKNIYYPETILEEEMQTEGIIQFKDQKSFQKTSQQDQKNPSQYQKLDDQFNQPSATLKEHQQIFQKFVQDNNMQLHQIYFQKRNYLKGHQMDQQTGGQRVKSEDYRRDYRQNYNYNMNEFKSYNKLQKNNHSVYEKYHSNNQNGRQNNHQHYSNGSYNNSDTRIRFNYSTRSNYNRNYELNSRNYNYNIKRNWNMSNENDTRGFQQYQNKKQNNLITNPFIDQPFKQQFYQNQNNSYHDKRNEQNQIEYNIQSERIQKQQSSYDFQNNNYNGHSDYSNQQNKNFNANKDSYNYRQNNNKYSKQNENTRTFQQRNLQKGDFQDQKQQHQYVLSKYNSYSKQDSNQQSIEPILYYGQNSNVIPDKQGTSERRERKSRLNQP